MENRPLDQDHGWENPTAQKQSQVELIDDNVGVPDTALVFGPIPVEVKCIHCEATVMTQTTEQISVIAWVLAGGMVMLGCFLGCCLIPLLVKRLKDVNHTCPSCGAFLGKYKASL